MIWIMTGSFLTSALTAGAFYRARRWSRKELWRILAFGSAGLLAGGFNLLVPSAGREPLYGVLMGFAFFFAMEHYATIHSCPEYLEECSIHWFSGLTVLALAFHSLLDGIILGVSASLDRGVFWAVLLGMTLHKFADAMTMMALLEEEWKAGYPRHLAAVLGMTLITPIGAALTGWLIPPAALEVPIIGVLMGFSAGSLIYVGASDILPRLHRLNDPPCFTYFLAGLAAMGVMLSVLKH